MSQPTLSRQVRRLEAELGVQLLDRSASGVVLTQAGRKALRGARQTVRSFDAMSEAIMAVDEQQPLRMGMPTLAMALLTNELLARLHRPGNPLRLSVSEASNTMLIEAVRSHQLDLAIATEVPPSPQLKAVVLWTEQLFLVGPPTAKKAPATISIAEAAQLPVIVGRAADPIRQCIAGAFEREGHSLRVEMELEGIASIKQVLEGRRLWATDRRFNGVGAWILRRRSVRLAALIKRPPPATCPTNSTPITAIIFRRCGTSCVTGPNMNRDFATVAA